MLTTRKGMEDLPHFQVSSVEAGCTLHGKFNRTDGIRAGRCWLLLPQRECLLGDLAAFDAQDGAASFQSSDQLGPDMIGASLPYLDGYWDAYHVWMVTEPLWKWTRVEFQRSDVTGEIVPGTEVQIIDGQEVKDWIRIQEASKQRGKSRYCPVYQGDRAQQLDRIIAAGWDHEHCELCQAHIDAGQYGFVDLGEHWVCEDCYARYVATHDLSFLAG